VASWRAGTGELAQLGIWDLVLEGDAVVGPEPEGSLRGIELSDRACRVTSKSAGQCLVMPICPNSGCAESGFSRKNMML
jgi:hypothetical protein